MNTVYKITAMVVFPEGVAPGAGSSSNRHIVARNGKDEPVLRGSALAGIIRSAYADKMGVTSRDDSVSRWFGEARISDFDTDSLVQVADAVINCRSINERTHNMVNRHTGAAAKGALICLEAIPPMSDASLSITLASEGETSESCAAFISDIAGIIGNGLIAGGNSNRGIGRMKLSGDVYVCSFNLDTVDGVAGFMDAMYAERKNGISLTGTTQKVLEDQERLSVSLELGIPRGEDLLVGDGQEMDYALQPQSVTFADGTRHWRIPGSSLRGIFRGWMTRLAARDGAHICDSIEQWYAIYDDKGPEGYKPDLAGWGFVLPEDRERYQKDPSLLNDPILDLFGSMYKKGRIHITDSFSQAVNDSDVQDRMHVAVDRFTGGANEGALFNNQVLLGSRLRFPVELSVESPEEDEVKWLVKTFRALHLGILNVGSSKSGGRLEIKSICAKGPGAEAVKAFAKEVK